MENIVITKNCKQNTDFLIDFFFKFINLLKGLQSLQRWNRGGLSQFFL